MGTSPTNIIAANRRYAMEVQHLSSEGDGPLVRQLVAEQTIYADKDLSDEDVNAQANAWVQSIRTILPPRDGKYEFSIFRTEDAEVTVYEGGPMPS